MLAAMSSAANELEERQCSDDFIMTSRCGENITKRLAIKSTALGSSELVMKRGLVVAL
jgi:hypothetical protein